MNWLLALLLLVGCNQQPAVDENSFDDVVAAPIIFYSCTIEVEDETGKHCLINYVDERFVINESLRITWEHSDGFQSVVNIEKGGVFSFGDEK